MDPAVKQRAAAAVNAIDAHRLGESTGASGARSHDWIDGLLNRVPQPSQEQMTWLWLALVATALLFFAWMTWADVGFNRRPKGPYKSRPILTPNEVEFHNRLVSALPGFVVLTQVAMSALIEPRVDRQRHGAQYMRERTKFAQKYVDFVVCHPGELDVIAIVELDDITHDPAKDAVRDAMLEGAGYRVVRWHSRRKPDRASIARTIRKLAA